MTALRLEGKVPAQKIQAEIQAVMQAAGGKICLAGVETKPDPSAEWYMGAQAKLAAKLGVDYRKIACSEVPDEGALVRKVEALSKDDTVHGIFISMPLPKGYDTNRVLDALDPKKDIEGIHPATLGMIVLRQPRVIPPTAYAAYQLLKSLELPMRGKRAVVVGQSAIVGRPLAILLGEERVTTTVCHSGTSTADMAKIVGESDFVFACAGQPRMIKGAWIKPGAVAVDVGTTEVNGQLVGDIEFDEACAKAAYVTPVPGGVGPLTTTLLFKNLANLIQIRAVQKI
jgi:methylenetetrahydrofolate dehydrogenase (NADP+)/methenyltetrahydrofolate cyclohydrolase